jgi:hypothetical protein
MSCRPRLHRLGIKRIVALLAELDDGHAAAG